MTTAQSATDIRNELWRHLRGRLAGERKKIYEGYRLWGACTARQLAARMKRETETVRPRVTELLQVGLLELVGKDGREGVYRAVSVDEAMRRSDEIARPQQMALI